MRGVGLGRPDALSEGAKHLQLEVGKLLHQAVERPMSNHEQSRRSIGRNRGRARAVVDERDLTQDVARASQRDLAAVALDRHRALDDDEELLPAIALPHEDAPAGQIDLIGQLPQPLDLSPAQAAEKRDRLQQLELLVSDSHAPLPVAC